MRKILPFSMPLFTWHFVNGQSQRELLSGTVTDNGNQKTITTPADTGDVT